MKHLKIYEQYDFDDLSEEDIFGKENWYIVRYYDEHYILQEFINDRNWTLYKDSQQHSLFEQDIKYVDHVDDHQMINYFDGGWKKMFFKDLPKDVKNKIEI